jgi:hypothetical protein
MVESSKTTEIVQLLYFSLKGLYYRRIAYDLSIVSLGRRL